MKSLLEKQNPTTGSVRRVCRRRKTVGSHGEPTVPLIHHHLPVLSFFIIARRFAFPDFSPGTPTMPQTAEIAAQIRHTSSSGRIRNSPSEKAAARGISMAYNPPDRAPQTSPFSRLKRAAENPAAAAPINLATAAVTGTSFAGSPHFVSTVQKTSSSISAAPTPIPAPIREFFSIFRFILIPPEVCDGKSRRISFCFNDMRRPCRLCCFGCVTSSRLISRELHPRP